MSTDNDDSVAVLANLKSIYAECSAAASSSSSGSDAMDSDCSVLLQFSEATKQSSESYVALASSAAGSDESLPFNVSLYSVPCLIPFIVQIFFFCPF